jgi:uncharacterized protein (DUF1697 family)
MSEDVFILLLRGINVGGNRIVPMEALRGVLLEAGLMSVKTYIQSGNVVFRSEQDEGTLTSLVEGAFQEAFGFSSRPTLRTLAAWSRMIAANPFAGVEDAGRRVHAVLLDAGPARPDFEELASFCTTERFEPGEAVLYLHTPDGFGRSRVAAMLDRTLKVPLTTRNWNTVLRLRDLATGLRR